MIDSHPPIEYRGKNEGVQVTGVSFPKRTIELVVMPYETETVVPYRNRMVRETVARGAFDGIENRPSKVCVNRDHDTTRLCGKAVSFRPSRDEGLVAEVRMSRTDLGTETLELAADGILGASAGFWPWVYDDGRLGEEWPQRDLRRLTKISLDHIAMTPTPAYADAVVLDVREAGTVTVATPNLDVVKGWRLADEAGKLFPVR
jgi:HK97 family phage prohead protease